MAIDYDEQFTGIVEKIGIFPIKESIKNQRVPSGEYKGEQFNIDKTHTVAFKIPELHKQWITVGHRKFTEGYDLSFRVEKGGEWVDVWDGSKITFMYAKNDAGYISIEGKSIRALKLAPCDQKVYCYGQKKDGDGDSSGGDKGGSNFNPVGAINGNAFNCAMILCGNDDTDKRAFAYAMEILKINGELKEEYKNGPAIGMAILSACKQTMDIKTVKASAERKLKGLIADIDARKQSDATPKKKATPQPDPVEPEPHPDIDEDDIPF